MPGPQGDAAAAAHRTCDDFRSGTWRLNVMPDAQGRGVGRFAVESVAAEIMRRDGTPMYSSGSP
jgi:diamine N-acetyltransferase